jgi:hypothetical protein
MGTKTNILFPAFNLGGLPRCSFLIPQPLQQTAQCTLDIPENSATWRLLILSEILSMQIRDGPLLAGIEKAKLLMLLLNQMMLVVRLPVTTIQFTLATCIQLSHHV